MGRGADLLRTLDADRGDLPLRLWRMECERIFALMADNSKDLKDNDTCKRIWIIGASSGIGRALALGYARAGHRVVASARRVEQLEALSDQSDRIEALPLDATKSEDLRAAVDDLSARACLPDQTIYCAAIYKPGGIRALSHAAASDHMAVNYLGAVALIEALLPALRERGAGKIAITASLTSYCGLPNAALYGPTKAALLSLCETLRPEVEQMGLGLQVINPGFVTTRLTEMNDFEMPFLMDEEEAAERIMKGLDGKRFEIAFPLRMAWLLRLLSWLPYGLYFTLMRRMVK